MDKLYTKAFACQWLLTPFRALPQSPRSKGEEQGCLPVKEEGVLAYWSGDRTGEPQHGALRSDAGRLQASSAKGCS